MSRVLLCVSLLAATAAAGDDGWRRERWTVEPFTAAMGGGPDWGPVQAVGASLWSMAPDRDGGLYLVVGRDHDGEGEQYVDIVTPDGLRTHLAGSGALGYRDGPAAEAQFRMGVGAYYGYTNIQVDDRRNVFVPDNGNDCVRRIFKDAQGRWTVETYAGGGQRKLGPGETCPPREAAIGGTILVVAAPDGQLTIATTHACYQVTADGRSLRCLGPWPASVAPPGRAPRLNCCGGDCDRQGNAYFVARTPDVVVRVTPDGAMSHIAGLVVSGRKPHEVGDGPPLAAYFDTPSSGFASPAGACVYACGGDEYDIRRVPTDLKTTTATLLKNGRWYIMPVHPNRNRGPAAFDPALEGKSRAEGGPLSNLVVAPLVGRDAEGNLYGKINDWSGRTQDVAGRGLLGTRVFRLRRLAE
ncbi:MAG TPA: hypothetical protein VNE39_04920 [Planctomycetota bacterium]|nr:hypothetical protein [Planctomycetota bacterium]